MKDTGNSRDRRAVQGEGCGKGHGASVPSSGMHSLSTFTCAPSQKLFEPHTLRIFMEASSCRRDRY